jgi:hypothetical protein
MASPTMARRLRLAAVATTPLVLIALLAWFNVFNPMARTFANTFEVVNDTSEPIQVTPLAYSFTSHERTPLPQLSTGRLALPILRSVHSVPPHASVTIAFDADDHGASDLVIQGPVGSPRWLALAEYPTGSPREQPSGSRWVIKSLSALPLAPREVLDAGRAAGRTGWWVFGAHFAFVVPAPLWVVSWRIERASKRAAA